VLALPARAGWELSETTNLASDCSGPVTVTLMLAHGTPGGRVGLEVLAEDGSCRVEERLPAADAVKAGKAVATTLTLAYGQMARILAQGPQEATWMEVLFQRADDAKPLGWFHLRGNARDAASRWQVTPRFMAQGFEVWASAADTLVLGPRPATSAPAGAPAGGEAGCIPRDLDGSELLELVKWVRERHDSMINSLREQSEVVLDLMTLCEAGRTRKPEPKAVAQAKEAPVALDILEFALDLDYCATMDRLDEAGEAADRQLRHYSREAEKIKIAGRQALEQLHSGGRTGTVPRPPSAASVLVDLDANLFNLQSWHDFRNQVQRLADLTQQLRFPADPSRDFRSRCANLLWNYLRVHEDAPALAEYLALEEKRAQARKAGAGREEGKAAKPARPRPALAPLGPLDPKAEAERLREAGLRQEALDRDAEASAKREAKQRQERRAWLAGIRAGGNAAAGAPASAAAPEPGPAEDPAGSALTVEWHEAALQDLASHAPAEVHAIRACAALVAECGLKTAHRFEYLAPINGYPKLRELRPRTKAMLRPLLYQDGRTLRILRIAPHGAEYPKAFLTTCKAADRLRQGWPAPQPGGGAAAPAAETSGPGGSRQPAGKENQRPQAAPKAGKAGHRAGTLTQGMTN
jgi:hypothetical protein